MRRKRQWSLRSLQQIPSAQSMESDFEAGTRPESWCGLAIRSGVPVAEKIPSPSGEGI